jgi:hypothetical protein
MGREEVWVGEVLIGQGDEGEEVEGGRGVTEEGLTGTFLKG